jgi:hypothetical protein
MTMTSESETTTKPKRGRPFGVFGPRKRQLQLIKTYIDALGGDANITPLQESDITRAVMLQSIAEQKRLEVNRHGASSAAELTALARIEETADAAVRRLNLPVTSINTRAAA